MCTLHSNIICNHGSIAGFDHSPVITNPNIDPTMIAPENAAEQLDNACLIEVHTP
jgi:hypothetical protein